MIIPYFLYNSRFLHLLSHLLVLSDEALDENVLVADTPTLIYNNNHKHQQHYDKGGGYGNGENNCYIHLHCLFLISTAKLGCLPGTIVPRWENVVPFRENVLFRLFRKRKKGVWNKTSRHLFYRWNGDFLLTATLRSLVRDFSVIRRRHAVNFAEDTEERAAREPR